jgi:cob(I)alamin adenosyltransferase
MDTKEKMYSRSVKVYNEAQSSDVIYTAEQHGCEHVWKNAGTIKVTGTVENLTAFINEWNKQSVPAWNAGA